MPATLHIKNGGKELASGPFTPEQPIIIGFIKRRRFTFRSTALGTVQRDRENKMTYLEPGEEVTFRLTPRGSTRVTLRVQELPPKVDPYLEPML